MAKSAILRFCEALKTDKQLRQDLRKSRTKEEVIILAFRYGFIFTSTELDQFWREPSLRDKPISDAELFDLTGGMYDEEGRLLVTVGYGCDCWSPAEHAWIESEGRCGSCTNCNIPNGLEAMFAYLGKPVDCFCEDNKLA